MNTEKGIGNKLFSNLESYNREKFEVLADRLIKIMGENISDYTVLSPLKIMENTLPEGNLKLGLKDKINGVKFLSSSQINESDIASIDRLLQAFASSTTALSFPKI